MGYCASIGHHEDPEAGLIYMRARYYEPATGRFISEDPARDGGNWFVYCENDPVQGVDADGLRTMRAQASMMGFLLFFGFKLFGGDMSNGDLVRFLAAVVVLVRIDPDFEIGTKNPILRKTAIAYGKMGKHAGFQTLNRTAAGRVQCFYMAYGFLLQHMLDELSNFGD